VAAVDYGRRRIGLAVTDPLRIGMRGLDTLHHEGDRDAAARAVAERLRDVGGVALVVVGLPLHASGEPSPMSREAERFGDALAAAGPFAVAYLDEGLTSWEAEGRLRERGRSVRKAARTGEVDREAAMALLATWLQEHPR
jgi:putative Holliday junction resolvase